MVHIDYLATEFTEAWQDPGQTDDSKDRISEVDDSTHSQRTQITELQELVRTLQNRADNAEDRHHRNNERVVGLPEGAEVTSF